MSQLKRITEIEISSNEATSLLAPLGFDGKARGEDGIEVDVPSFRQKDVTREIDLIEDVLEVDQMIQLGDGQHERVKTAIALLLLGAVAFVAVGLEKLGGAGKKIGGKKNAAE